MPLSKWLSPAIGTFCGESCRARSLRAAALAAAICSRSAADEFGEGLAAECEGSLSVSSLIGFASRPIRLGLVADSLTAGPNAFAREGRAFEGLAPKVLLAGVALVARCGPIFSEAEGINKDDGFNVCNPEDWMLSSPLLGVVLTRLLPGFKGVES